MNIKVTVLYCNRVTMASVQPNIKLIEIINHCVDGGFAKAQMLSKPGIYIPNKNVLCNGEGLNDSLDKYFPIIDLQGPPTELIILREEEFVQYEVSFKSQPQLVDSEPPNMDDSQPIKQQPNVDDLFPLSTQNLQKTVQQQQQSQTIGQDFVLFFETKDGLQQQKFSLNTTKNKITGNTSPDQLRDILFAHLGFNDRSIVDLNLYFNGIPLQGPKGSKTLDQLSINSGSNIEIKARWTGGDKI